MPRVMKTKFPDTVMVFGVVLSEGHIMPPHIFEVDLKVNTKVYLDLHSEGGDNGPVIITWISREHALYSGASPISLVEHCVTFRHDRRLLSFLGFVHNWPTSRWSATKKENWFSLNGNGIMSSFLGRQFYRFN